MFIQVVNGPEESEWFVVPVNDDEEGPNFMIELADFRPSGPFVSDAAPTVLIQFVERGDYLMLANGENGLFDWHDPSDVDLGGMVELLKLLESSSPEKKSSDEEPGSIENNSLYIRPSGPFVNTAAPTVLIKVAKGPGANETELLQLTYNTQEAWEFFKKKQQEQQGTSPPSPTDDDSKKDKPEIIEISL